jgi:hypothetical protein
VFIFTGVSVHACMLASTSVLIEKNNLELPAVLALSFKIGAMHAYRSTFTS